MDRTITMCIVLIACALLAYVAGQLDGKLKAKRKIEELKKMLMMAGIAQAAMSEHVKKVDTELKEIRDMILKAQEEFAEQVSVTETTKM